MDILVFGAGSLGSLLGGLLARTHEVTLVGREAHASAIQDNGLALTGQVAETVYPDAVTSATGLKARFALVTVKAGDTPEAAEALASGRYDAVCSLQNGMGNESVLADRLSVPVLAGATTYGALLEGPGQVACTGRGTVEIGSLEGGNSKLASSLADLFTTAGVSATAVADMRARLWHKLAINAAINPVTALADCDNGAILDSPAASVATAAAVETSRVAGACGIALSASAVRGAVEATAESTAENTSSMRRDLQRGRQTEIDAINGYVVRKAEATGIEVPTNRTLTNLVKLAEKTRIRS